MPFFKPSILPRQKSYVMFEEKSQMLESDPCVRKKHILCKKPPPLAIQNDSTVSDSLKPSHLLDVEDAG